MTLAWSNELSVGNAIIDSEHKNLLVMVNNIEQVFKTKDIANLSHELELLENWLCTHFENEERIARAIGFDFAKNKLEHQNLLKELHRIIGELKAMNGICSDSTAKKYFQYLCDWLTGHVIEEDMLMKPVLQTHEYHFHG